MGFVALFVLIIGWLLILVATFGSGFDLRVGNLHSLELGEVLVLFALCLGGAVSTAMGIFHRPAA